MVEGNRHIVKARDAHARGQQKVRSENKENAGHRKSQRSTQGVRPRDSPSPIHNTLGQVSVSSSSSQMDLFIFLQTIMYPNNSTPRN